MGDKDPQWKTKMEMNIFVTEDILKRMRIWYNKERWQIFPQILQSINWFPKYHSSSKMAAGTMKPMF